MTAAQTYPGSTAHLRETYEAVVRCLIANGARRQELGSGWWYGGAAIQEEATLGVAFEQLLDACGIDQRDAVEGEPEEFWG